VVKDITTEFRAEKVDFENLDAVETRQAALSSLTKRTKGLLKDIRSEAVRRNVLDEGRRIDGRAPADIRQIACEVSVVPRAHGTGLFTRGETQALVYATLGSSGDSQTIDALTERYEKNFLLHYNFPPFSVGEARFLRGPSRRDGTWRSGRSSRSCPTSRTSRTRCGWFRRCWSPTDRRPWPPSAAAPWR
jgi:polyribonucleotide nucleotidyltransferase